MGYKVKKDLILREIQKSPYEKEYKKILEFMVRYGESVEHIDCYEFFHNDIVILRALGLWNKKALFKYVGINYYTLENIKGIHFEWIIKYFERKISFNKLREKLGLAASEKPCKEVNA